MNKLRIWLLKRKARNLYLEHMKIGEHYDCGHSMLHEVSPEAKDIYDRYRRVLTRLRDIDPDTPK